MTALAERTIEVTPLGLRGRYSLQTRQQLRLYQAIASISTSMEQRRPTPILRHPAA
ncbi:MAG: hypothetical protein KF895_03125 [Parvibaculum sp.]|nr:hypothetical protein [Parvibaculum sp.]